MLTFRLFEFESFIIIALLSTSLFLARKNCIVLIKKSGVHQDVDGHSSFSVFELKSILSNVLSAENTHGFERS